MLVVGIDELRGEGSSEDVTSISSSRALASEEAFIEILREISMLATEKDDVDDSPLLCTLPNQFGNPSRRLKPPGGSRSSSEALMVSELIELVV